MAQPNQDPEKKIDDAVVTKPEETTPAPEVIPPAVNPEPDNELRGLVSELSAKVDSLSSTVESLITQGSPDSSPGGKPWTHWGR